MLILLITHCASANTKKKKLASKYIILLISRQGTLSRKTRDTPKKKERRSFPSRHYLSRARAEYGKIAQQNALSKLAREEVSAYTHAHTHTHAS